MEPTVIEVIKLHKAARNGNKGNPWVHEWRYSDGTSRRVVVGATRDWPARIRIRCRVQRERLIQDNDTPSNWW